MDGSKKNSVDHDLLRKVEIFNEFTETELQQIIESSTVVELMKNQRLFSQNDRADAFYILLHGHLLVSFAISNEGEKNLGEINELEMVGEMSLITDDRRSASVTASRRSTLLCLKTADFDVLWHKDPEILRIMMRQIVSRFQKMVKDISGVSQKRHLLIAPGDKDVNISSLLSGLNAANKQNALKIINYNDVKSYIKTHSKQDLMDHLDTLDKDYETVLFVYEYGMQQWNDICIELSDHFMVVVHPSTKPSYSDEIQKIIANEQKFSSQEKDLVIIHREEKPYPTGTEAWLQHNDYFRHHHIRESQTEDLARLYRFITGTAVALVLAGGGSRSVSQLGVLKAFEEYNIPIDCVGGASQGALNCWLISTGHSSSWMIEKFNETLPLFKASLKKFTLPLYAILSDTKATDALKGTTEGMNIEDMWKLNFSVAVDLSHRKEVVFSHGPAWKAMRASISIPAVFVPVSYEKGVLVDGGVMNNMPVDIMKDQVLHKDGIIIAIDLENKTRDTKYIIPDKYSFFKMLLGKFGVKKYQSRIPSIFDTLLRSLLVTAHNKTQENGLLADVLITLPVSQYKLLDYDSEKVDELIKIGYVATVKMIKSDPVLMKLANKNIDADLKDAA